MRHESNRDVAILMRLEAGVAKPWSASGLAKGIKDVLKRCAAKAGRPLRSVQVLAPEADFPSFDGRHPLKIAVCEV